MNIRNLGGFDHLDHKRLINHVFFWIPTISRTITTKVQWPLNFINTNTFLELHFVIKLVSSNCWHVIMYYLLYCARIVTDLQSQTCQPNLVFNLLTFYVVRNPILVPCIFQVVPPRPCMTSVTMTTRLHYTLGCCVPLVSFVVPLDLHKNNYVVSVEEFVPYSIKIKGLLKPQNSSSNYLV